MEKLIIELQDSIKLKDESSNRLHQEIEKLQSGNSLIVNQQQEYIDSLLQDNSVLNEKYQNISENFSKLQSQYDKLMVQNENLITENTLINAQLNALTNIEQKSLQFEESSTFFKNESLKLKESLEKHSKRFNDCTKEFQKEKIQQNKTQKKLISDNHPLKIQYQECKEKQEKTEAELVKFSSINLAERDYKKYLGDFNQFNINFKEVASR